jgi:hypothetical protein
LEEWPLKLITVEEAIKRIEQWTDIPCTHEVITSGIYRNSEQNQTPFYTMEVMWNKRGEPELDKEGLVNKNTILAVLDACTGKLTAFYRYGSDQTAENLDVEDMDDEMYRKVSGHIIQWIEKLGLPIDLGELVVRKKRLCGDKWYELSFSRARAGIPFRSYQQFDIRLDADDNQLLHLYCRWDDCEFEEGEERISDGNLLAKLTEEQLSLGYLPVLSLEKPFYVCHEHVIHAKTGELLFSDEIVVLERIALYQNEADAKPVKWNEQPIWTKDYREQLRLSDHVTEAAIDAPHPLFPDLAMEEKELAKELVRSYLSTAYADDPFEYVYTRKPDQEAVESFPQNRVVVHVHRMIHGIPLLMGGGIRFFFDRDTWELVQIIDALDFWRSVKAGEGDHAEEKGIAGNDHFRKALRTRAEAWDALKGRVTVKLRYMFDPHYPDPSGRGRKKAIPVYVIDCDCMYDGESGELVEL